MVGEKSLVPERLHSVKNNSYLEIAALFPFFRHRTGDEKARQFQNWTFY